MRIVFPLSLTVVVALVAGCGSGGREHAAPSIPARDLTLQAKAPEIVIASPVELQSLRSQQQAMRPSRPTRRPTSPPHAGSVHSKRVTTVVAAALDIPQPVSDTLVPPTDTASEPVNDRELPPGKTVTVIPASSGPSTGSEPTADVPEARGRPMVVRGGGTCRGRGRRPGIGIIAVPRPRL
jgi:hypothetical protein